MAATSKSCFSSYIPTSAASDRIGSCGHPIKKDDSILRNDGTGEELCEKCWHEWVCSCIPYELFVCVDECNRDKLFQIVQAVNAIWPFDGHWSITCCRNHPLILQASGQEYLNAHGNTKQTGESLANELAVAIVEANDGPCDIRVEAAPIEDEPRTEYRFKAGAPPAITRYHDPSA